MTASGNAPLRVDEPLADELGVDPGGGLGQPDGGPGVLQHLLPVAVDGEPAGHQVVDDAPAERVKPA